jgi:iron(III) transport system ATP-binding protein
MAFFEIQSVYKSFLPEKYIVSNFSLGLQKGQMMALVGESGSGKSTLLRILAGLENRDSGEVYLGGTRIQNPKEKLVPGYDEIQLVYQDYHLYPSSTVEQNIGRPLLSYDKAYKAKRVRDLLKLFGLEPFRDKLPRQLSGGQQQKVAIARALSLEPSVLLLDEPFSSLDGIQRRELIAELKEMFGALGVTVLFVTHDLDDALQMAPELVIIQKGKLIQRGRPEEIFAKPKNLYAAKLFSHLNPIPDQEKTYIRPADVQLFKTSGIAAKVIDKKYLIHYNQLTVTLQGGEKWLVEDKRRIFDTGERVFLKWEEKLELILLS